MTFLTVITRRPKADVVIRDDESRRHSLRLSRSLVLARNDGVLKDALATTTPSSRARPQVDVRDPARVGYRHQTPQPLDFIHGNSALELSRVADAPNAAATDVAI